MKKILPVLQKIGAYLKKSVAHNTALKIISLLFSLLLFVMVMSLSNPDKYKVVKDVPLEITGLSSLNARGLAITDAKSAIPSKVDVRVSVPLKNLSAANTTTINAQLSMSNIVSTGTHRVNISSSSRVGTTISVNPSYVEFTVENLVKSKLPVKINYTGNLPEGYRLGQAVLNTDIIQLSGAQSLVEKAAYALVTINLDHLTEDIVAAVPFTVMDAYGAPMAMDDISITEGNTLLLELPVYEVEEKPINLENMITGQVAPGYEITGVTVLPEKIKVAGSGSLLHYIDSLSIESIDVTMADQSLHVDAQVVCPQGVEWMEEQTVSVLIMIEEVQVSKNFSNIHIELRNVPDNMEAELAEDFVSIIFTGPRSLADALMRNQFVAYVDLSAGLPGDNIMTVQLEYVTGDVPLQVQLKPQVVHVYLTPLS